MVTIAVVGVGGVGGYFGGRLARYYASINDVKVVFIARGEHLRRIQADGLRQINTEGTFISHPDLAVDDPKGHGSFDIILFCVKRYDLKSSAKLIKNNVAKDSKIISLLNGVDNLEPLKDVLPDTRILNGCVYIGAHMVEPGVVRQVGGTCQLFFGPDDGNMTGLKEVETLFKEAGIKAALVENIQTVVWEKYLFVSPLASATTFLKQPIGAFVEKSENRSFLEGMMREVAAIANAKNIPISEKMIRAALDKNALFPYETKTSMQLDFEKGGRTEIDLFTGYIVKSGKTLGIDTPLHDMVYNKLQESVS